MLLTCAVARRGKCGHALAEIEDGTRRGQIRLHEGKPALYAAAEASKIFVGFALEAEAASAVGRFCVPLGRVVGEHGQICTVVEIV